MHKRSNTVYIFEHTVCIARLNLSYCAVGVCTCGFPSVWACLWLDDEGLGGGCDKRTVQEGVGLKRQRGMTRGLEMWGTKEGRGLKERSHEVRVGLKELKSEESWRRRDLKGAAQGREEEPVLELPSL